MSKIYLTHNNLLVIPDEPIDKVGSIILADYSKRRPTTGTIFMVGPEVKDVKAEDRVVYEDNARNELEMSGVKMYLMHEDNILAVIE